MNPNEIGDNVTDNSDEAEQIVDAEVEPVNEVGQLRAQLETADATADGLRETIEALRLELFKVYNTLDNLLHARGDEPKSQRRARPAPAADGGALVGIMTSPLTRKLAAQFGKSVIQAMTQGGER